MTSYFLTPLTAVPFSRLVGNYTGLLRRDCGISGDGDILGLRYMVVLGLWRLRFSHLHVRRIYVLLCFPVS